MMELGTGHATSTAEPASFYQRWIDDDRWQEWSPDTAWVRLADLDRLVHLAETSA